MTGEDAIKNLLAMQKDMQLNAKIQVADAAQRVSSNNPVANMSSTVIPSPKGARTTLSPVIGSSVTRDDMREQSRIIKAALEKEVPIIRNRVLGKVIS